MNCHLIFHDRIHIRPLIHAAPRAEGLKDFFWGERRNKSRRVVKPSICIHLVARSVAYGALYQLSAQAYVVNGRREKFISGV
jgi:hypothetical protein